MKKVYSLRFTVYPPKDGSAMADSLFTKGRIRSGGQFRLWTCLLLFVLSITFTNAQPLTLEAAVKQGLENNRQMRISSYKVSLAEVKYKEAVDYTLPSLKFSSSYVRQSEIEPPKTQFPGAAEPVVLFPVYLNNYVTKVSLYETVFSGFRLKYAQESQKLLEEAAKVDAIKDSDDVAYAIVASYFNLYKLEQSIKIVDENLHLLDEQNKESSQMVKQGVLLHNDLLRIQLQQSTTQLTRLELQNNLSVANFNFNILIGGNEKSSVVIDTNVVKEMPALNTLDAYLADAMKNRGDLQAYQLKTRSVENNYKIVKNSYAPQIGVSANYYDARPNPRIIPPKDQFVSTWDAGVSLTWDLTNLYSNRHQVADYKIQLQQSQESVNQLQDVIKMEVNQNYLDCVQSLEKIKVMQTTLEQAEESFRIMSLRYKTGLGLTSDYLDAVLSQVRSRIGLVLAKSDASVNYYKLLKATGNISNVVK